MKLWQKIFFPSAAFTLVGIYLVSLILVLHSHTLQVEAETAAIRRKGGETITELTRLLEEEKRGYFLSSGRREEAVREACLRLTDEEYEIAAGRMSGEEEKAVVFLTGETGILRFQTPVFLAGAVYRVEVSRDVRSMLNGFQEDIRRIRWYGTLVSLLISAALLLMVLVITRPIKYLKKATGRIAEGDYGHRIRLTGKDELAELAGHMNEMAAHIEADASYREQVSESRRKFIANMTHEMKTPLTSILGFADVLRIKPDLTWEERRQYADIIFEEADRLRNLSSRLMELITVEEVELSTAPMDVGEWIRREVEKYRPICEAGGVTCLCELETAVARIDETLFATLIVNLLDNARKASPSGSEITVRCENGRRRVRICIADRGCGIPADQIAHVTEAFYMVDKSRTRKAGGAGIGLSLCKAIAEAHHGELVIESRPGAGTAVTVFLPREEGEACE